MNRDMNRDTNDRGVVLANLEHPARTHTESPEQALRNCKPCPVRYSGEWREMRPSREETRDHRIRFFVSVQRISRYSEACYCFHKSQKRALCVRTCVNFEVDEATRENGPISS